MDKSSIAQGNRQEQQVPPKSTLQEQPPTAAGDWQEQLVHQMGELLRSLPANLGDFQQAEQMIREGFRRLAGEALEGWASQARAEEEPSEACSRCGGRMRHQGCQRVYVTTTVGTIRLRRVRRRCVRCGKRRYGEDSRVRFRGHGVSWELARRIGWLAAWIPAEHVRKGLWEECRVHLSKQTIQQVAYEAGRLICQQEDGQREQIFGLSPAERAAVWQRLQAAEGGQVAVIAVDGTMIHTEGAWREIRVGQVGIWDSRGWLLRRRTVARFLDWQQLGQMLALVAEQTGYRACAQRAFVGDGAPWVWQLAAMQFPDAVQVLDWYHLKEHVFQTAQVLYGEGSRQAAVWAKRRLDQLWEGRAGQCVRALEKQRRQRRSLAKRESLRQLIGYIRHNAERIDYPRYRRMGLPVGSGQVEGACKYLVANRCKLSGMRNWRKKNAEAILALRAALYDDRFDWLWTTYLPQAP